MRSVWRDVVATALVIAWSLLLPRWTWADVNAWERTITWEGTITIPTYPWEEDINPKFWALEGGARLSTTIKGSITYPYTMQDHLSRKKVDRDYKALFLENEYLRVACLPELGGRLHSVFDKTTGEEMFYLNHVIKPSMIAMRGAWISGGVEWNAGPQVHTVTAVSPVDVVAGNHPDGSAFLEISNQEKIFRTRWTVHVVLPPGRSYLDEVIRIENPTDGMHPYYFWNCTAFPNRPGTRFIYPMTLGTDHHGREFFHWPIHEGRDLTWLKNYYRWASVFAHRCTFDFFGAYDVDADRGIVQVSNHHLLPGKKAWTWGNWEFGLVSQQNLTDEDGPYIEVQSGPLPTQSDYGMLGPHQAIAWREWWYPVHGLGDGFDYATKDLAVRTARVEGNLELRLLATGMFPGAVCTLSKGGRALLQKGVDLSPERVEVVALPEAGDAPIQVAVRSDDGDVLAEFTTPLPIPKVSPPDPSKFEEKPDDQLTVEETYLKGRKYDRDTNRRRARQYYEMALADDPGHVASLRALAVLDLEAGLYEDAVPRLEKALDRDPDDGLAWYLLGVCHLGVENAEEAIDCGYQAVRCFGTVSLGQDLVGRAHARLGQYEEAALAFNEAVYESPYDVRARDHSLLVETLRGDHAPDPLVLKASVMETPTQLVPRALLALIGQREMDRFVREARQIAGEYEFNMIETSLAMAELGLYREAATVLSAACVKDVPESERSPLPLYYLAYYASRQGDEKAAREYLGQAAGIWRDGVFPSRPEAVDVLQYALTKNPKDARAHLHLGNLLGGLGRIDEAITHWQKAAEINPRLSIAWRNLGLVAASRQNDLAKAADCYRKAVAARPSDQTLSRDLAEILIADGRRPEAIQLLETMPYEGMRRADATVMLAQAYFDEKRYGDTIDVLESTPYFVNWEGQRITWVLFNKAHVARGRIRLERGDAEGALEDFEAALTYPENLGVGRSDPPQEATAQYWRGKALAALGRPEEARAAWKEGAAGAQGSDEQNKHRALCREALERWEAK
jgi:tetratricopeptide (TPR) repeat protein